MARGVYLSPFYTAETGIVLRLRALIQASSRLLRGQKIQVEKAVEWAQKRLGITLAEKQRQAVGGAISHKALVITGGPGTGKTTIVRAILEIYQELGAQVLLAAPTGRAAKRLSEATGREACTIHRLLEYSPRQGGFQRDQQRRLEADVVVVDEASMIDTILMYHLLKAIPRGATFILVGDVHQLPSVGPGSVLRDILQSGVVEVVELTEIFRQARESTIVLNAHRINQGQLPQIPPADKRQLADFYFIAEENPPKVAERIVELCSQRIPSRFQLDPLNEIQVLTPMNRGEVGTQGLNQALQQALNPHGQEVTRLGRSLRLGDKVMQIRNNYDKEVYNGDIGRIVGIDLEEQELTVRHDVGEVTYDFSELDELILAYAISVHRAQGSEYPAIVMPLLAQHYPLLQRNLLYTAVTRARRLVVLIGSRRALAIAVKNDQVQKRYTWLAERLRRGPGGSVRPLDEELPAEDLWIGGQ
ncbi:MAG: AAA family ATPase [Candidatus Tectomicrobia bacterium]|uniref:AAA family ATPase n=1 Tax=Tectimicrobiota bacterium TaxID=2528274 RepID=A0A932CNG1_UNCTE|nr:AAA family ATPase [Candidatus Tectomicrobia bacterium]